MAIYTFKTQPIPLLYLLARTPDAIEEWVKWFFSPPKKRLFNNNYSPDNFLYFDLVPSKDKCHTESISDLIKIEEKCEIHVDLGGSLCDVAPLYIPLEEGLTLIVHIEHMAIFSEEVVK